MKPFDIAFVGTAIALSVAATPVDLDVTMRNVGTGVVPKTVVSSDMRFVFAVGLEGTGQNYFVDVLDHLFQTNEDLVQISGNDSLRREMYAIDHSMAGNAEDYSTALVGAKDDMRRLKQRGAELEYPGTVVFMHSRNSYPNGDGPNKALKYVDLRVLAEVAEEEGVDLRVLYLRRRAKEMIISNTVHQNLQR